MPKGSPGIARRPFSDYSEQLKAKGLVLVSTYRGATATSEFSCLSCEHSYTTTIQNAIASRYGCPACANFNRRYDRLRNHDEYMEDVRARYQVTPIESYSGARIPIRHECLKCEGWWIVSPADLKAGLKCPHCSARHYRVMKLGNREVKLRGYEPQALEWILENTSIRPEQIVVDSEGTIPGVEYRGQDGLWHRHRPDFYVPDRNLLVEVKSLATLGILGNYFQGVGIELWNKQRRKARAARRSGYRYNLLVMDPKGMRVPIPVDWIKLSYREALKLL